MGEKDKEFLLLFITRISMYTSDEDREKIISFIHGYETGTENKCDFTIQLRRRLEDKYHYEYRALGWPYQIEQYSNRRRIRWVSDFRRISLELINEANTDDFQQKLNEFIRKWVSSKANHVNMHFFQAWLDRWLEVCDVKQDWFKKIWTQAEWRSINKLTREVRSIRSKTEEPIQPTDKLLIAARELSENLKTK